MTIELSEYVIDAIADAVVKKMQEPSSNSIKTGLEPCGDTISRQAVLDAIDTYDKFGYTETGCFVREPKGDYVPYIHYDDVIKCIKNASPVTPQQKMGHWIHDGSHWENRWICSECGYKLIDVQTNYCPNCGAKMQEVEEC